MNKGRKSLRTSCVVQCVLFQLLPHVINASMCFENMKYKIKVLHIFTKLSMDNYIFQREEG